MPLYELLIITSTKIEKPRLAALMKTVANQVLKNDGVVRKFEDLKTRQLPYTMSSHQNLYHHGYFWSMTFDIKPSALENMKNQLDLDSRVIKHNIIKLGSTFEETVKL